MGIIALIIKHRWLIGFIGIGLFVVGGYAWHMHDREKYGKVMYDFGYEAASFKYEVEKQNADEKIRKNTTQARHETQPLDRAGLIAEWCKSGRVRNPQSCPQ